MSTTGPLNAEQLTRGETLDEFCVGPKADLTGNRPDVPMWMIAVRPGMDQEAVDADALRRPSY
jgi:hypothetical protein